MDSAQGLPLWVHFRDRGSRGDRFSLRLKSRGVVVRMFRHLCDVPLRTLAVAGTEEGICPSHPEAKGLWVAASVRLDGGLSLAGPLRLPVCALPWIRFVAV